ncbi:hypothetical protein PIB30_000457 [Stylosanthes scabra]|uniref:Transposase (Putative), gypsy type n=1 Tax=Stylosanthes scabra TaxID=79078 RepID=A0ABU6V0R9_9FABA|nr:hypothetical protein [Stylosanthes scabra]
MGKKKSCQNVKVPRPLSAVEQGLYGWVEETIFTQPSVLEDSLLELRRRMSLTEDAASEGDFILEAAGPSDRLPFQAGEGEPHFLWVYQELFTRLGVRLPFTDFQKEVMTRCWVAVSQLHLNGRGLLRTFERESIQEFKWHYFKVLPAPSRRAFWLDDSGNPFPWVYWNRVVKNFVIHSLDLLETAAFDFLVSLSAGLPKRNNLTCRWILDHPDAIVGKFLDDLLLVKMKKTKLDRMMAMMDDPSRMAPSSSNPATLAAQVPPPPPASSKAKKSSVKRERLEAVNVEGEEGAREDSAADLKQKRRRKDKGKEEDLVDRVLGEDSAWEHAVNPLDLAFPKEYNYRKALDGGLTSSFVRKHLQGVLPDQLLGESWRLSCQSLACLQIGLESALAAKIKAVEALLAAEDQASVLKAERDSALEKVEFLSPQLSQKEVEHRSALEQVARLDEDVKVLKAQLESSQLSVSKDQKRAESAESKLKSFSASFESTQAELGKAREEANYWCTEWKSLGTEAKEMCQETLEIVLDQVSHLCLGVDFSAINLKTRWDSKGRRIYIPEELLDDGAEAAETLPEVVVGQQ